MMILVLILIISLISPSLTLSSCPNVKSGTTLILVADPGTFSGTPENYQYTNNLISPKKWSSSSTPCSEVVTGTIMNLPVMIVTTGIGPMASSTCTFDILRLCGTLIKDVFYTGTSGWSPAKGGIINNGTCEKGLPNTKAKQTRVGDVCVSPLGVNWDCRKASWESTATNFPNECTFPKQLFSATSEFLFGQCIFNNVTLAQYSLADEVLQVSSVSSSSYPIRKKILVTEETEYWNKMKTGMVYPKLSPTSPPQVWNYAECTEIDSQYFWSGVSWDMVARNYVATTISSSNDFLKSKYGKGVKVGQDSVIAVSAMEAIGLGYAMEKYYQITKRRIPFVTIRGMSNWVHTPLVYLGEGNWTSVEFEEDFVNGYAYAIATSATTVLNVLKVRCGKSFKSGCTFKIKY